jgi:hypothetical protein
MSLGQRSGGITRKEIQAFQQLTAVASQALSPSYQSPGSCKQWIEDSMEAHLFGGCEVMLQLHLVLLGSAVAVPVRVFTSYVIITGRQKLSPDVV